MACPCLECRLAPGPPQRHLRCSGIVRSDQSRRQVIPVTCTRMAHCKCRGVTCPLTCPLSNRWTPATASHRWGVPAAGGSEHCEAREGSTGMTAQSTTDEAPRHDDIEPEPTSHARLLAWVNEIAELTQPDRVHWCNGSDDEWATITDELVENGTLVRLNPDKKPNSFWAASDPTDVARVEDRTFICSVEEDGRRTHQQLDGAGRDEGDHDRPLPRVDARSHHVRHPVRDGPPRGRDADVRRGDHRLRRTSSPRCESWRGWAVTCCDGWRSSTPTTSPACTRSAHRSSRDQQDVGLAVQRHQVHHPLPRGADDLELRLRLRRQRTARQEVLRAADRLREGSRRGLAGRAHADPQAHLSGAEDLLRRRRVPERVRQDQPRHARADDPWLEGRDPGRRHRLDALRRRRSAVRRQPRVRLLRRRTGHQREDQPERHAHDRARQLPVHQRGPDRRRRHLVGGHGEHAGSRHVVEEGTTGLRTPTSCPATPTAATARRSSSARSSRRSTTTRVACRSTRSCSAAAARPRFRW